MEESSFVRLDLRAPLLYTQAPGLEPFASGGGGDFPGVERLFCFELDPAQSAGIEPLRDCFPGTLVFAGLGDSAGTLRLPAGCYLFTQKRGLLGKEGCIDTAVEQQKDGLWERLKLENRFYIRYLFEDGKPVTQIFRGYRG